MRKLTGRMIDNNPTDDAVQIANICEQALGIQLYNRSATEPNNVHGYLTTSSDGLVEVYLYDQEDVDRLNPRSTANLVPCTLEDGFINDKLAAIDYERADFEIVQPVTKL